MQRGFDKIPLPMMAGKYRVIATLKKDKDARQTGRREIKGGASITVRRAKKSTKNIDLSDGKMKIALFHNGRRASGAGTLYLPGTRQEVARVVITERETRGVAPPGVYDLVTRLDDGYDFAEQKKKRFRIVAGKTAKASLRPQDGQPRGHAQTRRQSHRGRCRAQGARRDLRIQHRRRGRACDTRAGLTSRLSPIARWALAR